MARCGRFTLQFELRMNEPIRARVSLLCTLRQPYLDDAAVECVTEELARDWAVVVAGSSPVPGWLRPGCAATLLVELPAAPQRDSRVLECHSAVFRLQHLKRGFRVRLEVHRMSIVVLAGERRISAFAGDRP